MPAVNMRYKWVE